MLVNNIQKYYPRESVKRMFSKDMLEVMEEVENTFITFCQFRSRCYKKSYAARSRIKARAKIEHAFVLMQKYNIIKYDRLWKSGRFHRSTDCKSVL